MNSTMTTRNVFIAASLGASVGFLLAWRRSRSLEPAFQQTTTHSRPSSIATASSDCDDDDDDDDEDPPPHLTPLGDEAENEELEVHQLGDVLGVEVTLPSGWRQVSTEVNFPSAQVQFVLGEEGLASVCQPFLSLVAEDLGRSRPGRGSRVEDAVAVLRDALHSSAADAAEDDLAIAELAINDDKATANFVLVTRATGAVAAYVHAATVLFDDGLAITLQHVTQTSEPGCKPPTSEPPALALATATLRRVKHRWVGKSFTTLRNPHCLTRVTLPTPRSIASQPGDAYLQAFSSNSVVMEFSESTAAGSGAGEEFDLGIAVCPIPLRQHSPEASGYEFLCSVWDDFASRNWTPSTTRSLKLQRRLDVAVASYGRLTSIREGRQVAASFVVLPQRLNASAAHCCVVVWGQVDDEGGLEATFCTVEKILRKLQHGIVLPAPGTTVSPVTLELEATNVVVNPGHAYALFPEGWCARRPVMGPCVVSISPFAAASSEAGALSSVDVSIEASGVSALDVIEQELAAIPTGATIVFKDGRSTAIRFDTGVVLVLHSFETKPDAATSSRYRVVTPTGDKETGPEATQPAAMGGHRRVLVLRSVIVKPPTEEKELLRRVRKVATMMTSFNLTKS